MGWDKKNEDGELAAPTLEELNRMVIDANGLFGVKEGNGGTALGGEAFDAHLKARSTSCDTVASSTSLRRLDSPIAMPLADPPSSSYEDVEFRAKLRAGIVATKHSRRGKPHTRLLVASEDFEELVWLSPDKPRGALHSAMRFIKKIRRPGRVLHRDHARRVGG